MKGLLFGGCSFTWGQGLYFYSELNRLVYPKTEYGYSAKDITDAQIKFKDTIRFPRLVADHFKTFEVFKNVNGGSEDESFDFFDYIFSDQSKNRQHSHFGYDRYQYDDFEFIILQLSQLYRNKFYFELDGVTEFSNFTPKSDYADTTKLLKWMDVNNFNEDEWGSQLSEQQLKRLIERLLFYEEKGIKTLILPWEDQMLHLLKSNEFLNKRLIPINYNNNKFDTIDELQKKHKNMVIKYDYEFFGEKTPEDHHPSKLCHKVLSESIINHIEKNYL